MENMEFENKTLTEDDFEQMTWHDNKIYAMAFGCEEFEIAFDIDYILKWINLGIGETNFKFLVVPATLVFRNVYDINCNFYLASDIRIDRVYKNNPVQPKNIEYIKSLFEYDWTIETNCGEITFKSVGYNQYVRQKPKLLDGQIIDIALRGGISFSRITCTS